MALNGEELHAHEKFKREQYARPTKEQSKITELQQQLEHSQNTINHLNNWVDKLVSQRDRANYHLSLYDKHERSAGITLDAIRAVIR